ncbi:uncharacterized protein Z518_05319 [Rhinocladiella mackenziei CBS 650.93]|uniref:GPI anchored protein n=1 Tax=Rhinocladiella mackenziei CBS 650.93 TaxID=1442369 RepID=A0A0D2IMU3_9EURO|nr:uncharacterized protein Z518_05319 [Rhinocladiella mackenziei CBS 650.93]KIX04451.1 hypothetical protein Z518_05319 [Rhinocladiella mackenziei CBS 650.93]
MGITKNPVIALTLTLAGIVSAQSSVVNIFFPGADQQTLVGSIIASDSSKTTMAVACPSDADTFDCGLIEPITVTVGSSTFHAEESFETISVTLDCAVTGTTAATCEETYVGPAGLIETDIDSLTATDATINTQVTTTATTTTLSQTEIAFIPVTISAGAVSNASAGTGATGSASTTAATGSSETQSADSASGTSSSSSSSGSATPPTESGNGAAKSGFRVLASTAAGAGLIGLTIALL